MEGVFTGSLWRGGGGGGSLVLSNVFVTCLLDTLWLGSKHSLVSHAGHMSIRSMAVVPRGSMPCQMNTCFLKRPWNFMRVLILLHYSRIKR